MSKAAILKQYQQALVRWPEDALRPDLSFPKLVQKAIEQRFNSTAGSVDVAKEQARVNALYTLLENRYTKRYPLSNKTLMPKSKPQYYNALMKEIEEAPKRSWFGRQINKWKGFIRWK